MKEARKFGVDHHYVARHTDTFLCCISGTISTANLLPFVTKRPTSFGFHLSVMQGWRDTCNDSKFTRRKRGSRSYTASLSLYVDKSVSFAGAFALAD